MKFLSLFKILQEKKRPPRRQLLRTQGQHYDLKAIYEELNTLYFDRKLTLAITWFGSPQRTVKCQRILGLYDFRHELIKIHRLLDHPHFPPYFISYVVYHEMLHSLYPPIRGKRGRNKIHHLEFKEQERCFAEYAIARQWEQENKHLFFRARGAIQPKEEVYGWAQ